MNTIQFLAIITLIAYPIAVFVAREFVKSWVLAFLVVPFVSLSIGLTTSFLTLLVKIVITGNL